MKYCLLVLLSVLTSNYLFAVTITYKQESLQILHKHSYTLGYSTNHNQAIWCMYQLTKDQLIGTNKVNRTENFRDDQYVTNNLVTSILYSYVGSGYDKGHLCPAQDRSYNLDDMSETFLMSNMCPQEPSFNRGIWKRLEIYTRNFAISHTNIIVVTGPVILPRYSTLKNNNCVSIPDLFYKVIIDIQTNETECYLIPHVKSDIDIRQYHVSLNYIETISGIKIHFK